MSVFLEIDDGREWAVEHLPRHPDFTPSLQIYLARLYGIDHWVEPAFRQLMSTPTTDLSTLDAERIGLAYYHILIKTKAQIDQHRRSVAFSAPDAVNDPFCVTAAACTVSWISEWWRGLAPQLLHPDAALTEQEILSCFDQVMIPGMCDSCQAMSIDWVKAREVFMQEEKIMAEAVKEVMSLQTDEPIRASLRKMVVPD
jgi:hypothetical protein